MDFGIVVDSTVIMMENIFRHLGDHGKGSMRQRILAAAREVGTPMSFSTLIIGVAFLPLFTLTGVPGAIFAPMARTYAFAIGGAICLALTLTPVLSRMFMPANLEEKENFLMRGLYRIYNPLFAAAMRWPTQRVRARDGPGHRVRRPLPPARVASSCPSWRRATSGSGPRSRCRSRSRSRRASCRACATSSAAARRTRPSPAPTRTASTRRSPPSSRSSAGPTTAPTSSGFFNIEFFAPLEPFDEWPKGLTKEKLTDELQGELQAEFPGAIFGFSQYINDNVEEAVAGVKGENSVKVYGPSLEENERIAAQIIKVMEHRPRGEGPRHVPLARAAQRQDHPDRRACARYGLNTGDVAAVIQAAIGGQAVTQVYEGEKVFDLAVRWLPEYRGSIEAISEITVATPDGNNIPLAQIAKIEEVDGPRHRLPRRRLALRAR